MLFSNPLARILATVTAILLAAWGVPIFGRSTGLAAPPAGDERLLFTNSVVSFPADVAATARPLRREHLQEQMSFEIALRMRDYPKLVDRIGRLEIVPRAELERDHLPPARDYEALAAWLRQRGFTITRTDPNRLAVFVQGTVAKIQQELQVEMVEVAREGKSYYAARTHPSLPRAIAAGVLGINGLQPYLHARKPIVFQPQATSSDAPPYHIGDILNAYNAAGVTTSGASQTIAILIDAFPNNSDLTAFWTNNGIAQSLSNITEINVGNATLPAPSGEETLDVEWSSGIAPNAKIRVYAASSLELTSIDQAIEQIIDDLPSQPQLHQLSISLGLGETYVGSSQMATDAQYFATIASQGVSIFVSSGDAGSDPNGSGKTGGPTQVEYYASDPSVAGVGGTSLKLNSSTDAVTSETAWSGSGGGASIQFSRPIWQTGAGVPSGTTRLVPDISSSADPDEGAYVYLNGAVEQVGGTSWAAPTWAGFCALINQARAASSQAPLGLMGPHLYPLVGTTNFRDITSGSNGAYSAGVGYDEVTGLGAPNVGNLLQTLVGSAGSPPVISGFTPASGPPGTVVAITGSNLSAVTAVAFNGTAASFTLVSSTQLTAVVPSGATTGPISLTNASGSLSAAAYFTVQTIVANDDFADAIALTGAGGSVTGSNAGATKESGEPDHAGNPGGASVWYAWTAPANGLYTFNTFGSNFDTLLAVYTGMAVNALTPVAANDDAGTGVASEVSFSAIAGVVYNIAIDGHLGPEGPVATGAFTLTWAENSAAPTLDTFLPDSGAAGTAVVLDGASLTGATGVLFNGVPASFTVVSPTQITATVPAGAASGPITVTTPNGSITSAASFLVLSAPVNDDFANAFLLTGAVGAQTGTNVGATKESGEPEIAGDPGGASVWFTWTAPTAGICEFSTAGSSFDTLLGVYTGTSVSALTPVATNDDSGAGIVTSSVTFVSAAGVTYQIGVDGKAGATGNIVLSWSENTAAANIVSFVPANGEPGTSVALTGGGFLGATNVAFNGTSASFTVNSDGQLLATVPAGAATGPIAVTTGNGSGSSTTSFTVTASPANDLFTDALPIPPAGGTVTGVNTNGTKEPGEPDHAGNAGGASVWWSWTPSASGLYTVSTAGSSFTTLLAVYTGAMVSNLTPIANNDNVVAGDYTSSLVFNAVAGATYMIAVDGENDATGSLVLAVAPSASGTSTLFATGFETTEGYSTSASLGSQQGWQLQGSGGNTIVAGDFTAYGQQAVIGQTAPNSGTSSLYVWPPVSYTPLPGDIVTFNVLFAIVRSTNNHHDTFAWVVDNIAGDRLFELDFDDASSQSVINYVLDNGVSTSTSYAASYNSVYGLQITINYPANVWSASIGGTALVTNEPVTTQGNALTLGSIRAGWELHSASRPGNNYMIFDNYSITKTGASPPSLALQPASQTAFIGANVALKAVAIGAAPLTYQWQFAGSNIPGAASPTLLLSDLQLDQSGAYTLVVTNAAGTATSAPALVSVIEPAAFYDVSVAASPAVGGVVSGAGSFPAGGVTTVIATASSGYAFANWSLNGAVVSSSPNYTFNVAAAGNLVAAFQPTTLASWQNTYFTAAQLDNPAISGPCADPTGAGIPNLLAYAFGLNPLMPSQAALPQATLASGVLTLTYLQNDFASDLAFTVQVSSDLVNWSSGTGATTAPVTLSDNGLVRTLQVSDANPPASGAPRFIRLQVSGE